MRWPTRSDSRSETEPVSLPRSYACAVLMLSALVVDQRDAVGAGDDEREQAREHFKKGQSHYALREFDAALVEFKDAFKLKPDPAFLFNIAQCQRFLGDVDGALWSYRQYLRSSPAAPNRAEVEARILELDKKRGPQPGRSLEPPSSALVGGVPAMGGDRVSAAPPPVAPPPPSIVSSPRAPMPIAEAPPSSTPIYKRWWFWAVVGAVVVGGAGVTFAATHDPTDVPSTPLGHQRAFP